MGEAVERLTMKLSRVVVPPHTRVRAGKTQHVEGYTYERDEAPIFEQLSKPRSAKQIRAALSVFPNLEWQGDEFEGWNKATATRFAAELVRLQADYPEAFAQIRSVGRLGAGRGQAEWDPRTKAVRLDRYTAEQSPEKLASTLTDRGLTTGDRAPERFAQHEFGHVLTEFVGEAKAKSIVASVTKPYVDEVKGDPSKGFLTARQGELAGWPSDQGFHARWLADNVSIYAAANRLEAFADMFIGHREGLEHPWFAEFGERLAAAYAKKVNAGG